ncbi:MAG: Rid family detoxifying hydrolase [Brumimicrobium sp.]
MKKSIIIPNAPKPIAPYSPAILKDNTLYISGQIPLNPATGELVNDSIANATQQVMENIKALIKAAGFEMSDIVKCSIFMTSMDYYGEINDVYARYFKEIPPAREAVAVKTLPRNVSVEISCIAMR